MHPLRLALVGAVVVFAAGGCRERVKPTQCDQLVARFAELVVRERFPDASAVVVEAEQKREREEAVHEDVLRNCTTEVQPDEFRCAMAAPNADAFEKCLE